MRRKRIVTGSIVVLIILSMVIMPSVVSAASRKDRDDQRKISNTNIETCKTTKTRHIGVWKIKDNSVTYQKCTDVESYRMEEFYFGGKKRTIQLAQNAKFYWWCFDFEYNDSRKYEKVSKSVFTKRINKGFYKWRDQWRDDTAIKGFQGNRDFAQCCKVKISKGKIIKIWAIMQLADLQ